MNAYLPAMQSEQRDVALSQWYTPPKVAARLWEFANRYHTVRSVLEPAAGRGALLLPVVEQLQTRQSRVEHICAVDVDPANTQYLEREAFERLGEVRWSVHLADFLTLPLLSTFDLALMNPPYENNAAEAFIERALEYAPRVVGIFKASILHGAKRHRGLWSKCHTTREVRLMSRPSFGKGETGDSAKTDFVVLEIQPGPTTERGVVVEQWP